MLPTPSTDEIAHSQQLSDYILERMPDDGMPFCDFMQHALYAPGLGYYSGGLKKLGVDGDFITAPELSPLFSRCLARQCQQVLEPIPHSCILEVGAGSGIMAADLLLELEQLNSLPETYFILELSANLKTRQKQTLEKHCPHLLPQCVWLDELPTTPIKGIVLANEVLDAMPVHLFQLGREGVHEKYVTYHEGSFLWKEGPVSSDRLNEEINRLKEHLPEDYTSEINLYAKPWLQSIFDILDQGILLTIDYGFPEKEYYHPDRTQGSLMCHYRHQAHSNPLILIGLQDITAHVDFTALAQAGHDCGFDIIGFNTQALFLMGCQLLELSMDAKDEKQQFANNQAIKQLTLPHEMGELFKVMAFSKNVALDLMGFSMQDLRHRL